MPDVFPYRVVGGKKRYIVNRVGAAEVSAKKDLTWMKSSAGFGQQAVHVRSERSRNVRANGAHIEMGVTSG